MNSKRNSILRKNNIPLKCKNIEKQSFHNVKPPKSRFPLANSLKNNDTLRVKKKKEPIMINLISDDEEEFSPKPEFFQPLLAPTNERPSFQCVNYIKPQKGKAGYVCFVCSSSLKVELAFCSRCRYAWCRECFLKNSIDTIPDKEVRSQTFDSLCGSNGSPRTKWLKFCLICHDHLKQANVKTIKSAYEYYLLIKKIKLNNKAPKQLLHFNHNFHKTPIPLGDFHISEENGKKLTIPSLPDSPSIEHVLCTSKEKFLAKGRYGHVTSLEHKGNKLAVKKLFPSVSAAQFTDEVSILRQCQSENVVKYLGYSMVKGKYRILMTFCPSNLANIAATKKITLATILPFAKGIANGLAFIHKQKIVHSDLKPENILIDSQGKIRICDFGHSWRLSHPRYTRGTIIWTAPEIFKRDRIPSQKTDIYTYGLILWYLCKRTGETPWDPTISSDMIISWIMNNDRPKIETRWPKNWVELITSCWSHLPENRPQISDIISTLNTFANFRYN